LDVSCRDVGPLYRITFPEERYVVYVSITIKVAALILTVSNSLRTITVGKVPIGSAHPVAKQTMATTVTKDVEASVAQVMMLHMSARKALF
jgi:hypothetical protein